MIDRFSFDLAAEHDDLDPHMVAVGGVSLGGGLAVRCAAYDRRLIGAMAITPPYDPLAWWQYANPLVRMQLLTLAVTHENPEDVVADFDLTGLAGRLQTPLLVFGAGRDLVVPPEESVALAARLGDLATLVWYPEGGHGLYGEMDRLACPDRGMDNGLVDRNAEPAVESDDVMPLVYQTNSRRIHIPVLPIAVKMRFRNWRTRPPRRQAKWGSPRVHRVDEIETSTPIPEPDSPTESVLADDEEFDDLWDER